MEIIIITIIENEKLYFMISIVAQFSSKVEPIIAFRRKQLLSSSFRSFARSLARLHSCSRFRSFFHYFSNHTRISLP